MLVAKSQEKESFSRCNVFRWKEYQIICKNDLYVLQYRWMNRLENGEIVVEFDWVNWSDEWISFEKALCDCAGDSDYMKAISLHPKHAKMVQYYKKCWEISDKKTEKENLVKEFANWKMNTEYEFNRKNQNKDAESYSKILAKKKTQIAPIVADYKNKITNLDDTISKLQEESQTLFDELWVCI